MTPPPPKIYVPVAEPEPPSTTKTTTYSIPHHPANTPQSPTISIQLTPALTVGITISNRYDVENPYSTTSSAINIFVNLPNPVHQYTNLQ